MISAVEEQKQLFEWHLRQQQLQRESKLEIKRLEQLEKKNPEEHMLYIQKQFKAKSQKIEQSIQHYKDKAKSFQELMLEFSLIKEYYVNVSYAMKTYDRQAYKQALQKLYNTIIQLQKKNQPRKKFKFSRREQDFGVKGQQIKQDVVQQASQVDNISGVQGQSNQILTIAQDGEGISSYKIVECNQSQIILLKKTQILFLKNLSKCTIKAALTKSTVFVDNCNDCTLQISCHQLRIHNSYRTTFAIFVTSKAIIEDCNQVIFTPYNFVYEKRDQDEQQFQRKGKENLWREIQDFNWLKQNQKSPHYELVEC